MRPITIATITAALAAAFTSAQETQVVPDKLCAYVEFPLRYSGSHEAYYPVVPDQQNRGRVAGTIRTTDATSIRDNGVDLNGNPQLILGFYDYGTIDNHSHSFTDGAVQHAGWSAEVDRYREYKAAPRSCDGLPPNEGLICARGGGLFGGVRAEFVEWYLTSQGLDFEGHEHHEIEKAQPSDDCLALARQEFPGYDTEGNQLPSNDTTCFVPLYREYFHPEWGKPRLYQLGFHRFIGRLPDTEGIVGWQGNTNAIAVYEEAEGCPALPTD